MTKVISRKSCRLIDGLACVVLLGVLTSTAAAQDGVNTLSHDVAEKTVTFAAVNPYTDAAGTMSITFKGEFRADKVVGAAKLEVSRVSGFQSGTFEFVPDDSAQPRINGRFRFRFSGQPQPHMTTIHLAFRIYGRTPDGSVVGFLQKQEVTITEDSVEIKFTGSERID